MTATVVTTLHLPLPGIAFGKPLTFAKDPETGLVVSERVLSVDVAIDPDLPTLGEQRPPPLFGDGGPVIILREWNEQVLLHEVLHVLVGMLVPVQDQEGDPHLHKVVTPMEVALAPFMRFERPAQTLPANETTGPVMESVPRAATEPSSDTFATDDPAAVAAIADQWAEDHPDTLLDALTRAGVLREKRQHLPAWGERPRTAQDGGLVLDDSPVRFITGWVEGRIFVTDWREVTP